MIFDRSRRIRSRLQRELRAQSPEPPEALVDDIVGRVADAERRPQHSGSRLRLGVGFALTAMLLVVMAAFGGVGYAQTAVADTTSAAVNTVKRAVTSEPTRTTSLSPSPSNNFAAAVAVYPAPTLTCSISFQGSFGNSTRRLTVTGTTTLAAGTITVTVSQTPSGPPWPITFGPFAATTSWSTGQSPSGSVTTGKTYTATVTQTAAGYADGTTTCTATT
jgi:hypothetical protein